ncbi:hypothetical protein [Acetivibrio cellulolyticus]|uniref:hypothetical protein n=1 Tax=Acetivibrio cellulolyticus TaxID=35830 RepID=UPI0002481BC7|nr:hypothetical protein [Acetivibrio cellulolyticus]
MLKYLFIEVIVKYLLCYVIAALSYVVAINVEDLHIQTVIINVASSLISLPLVFIVYDLYQKILMYKSTKLISQVVDKYIGDIFLKFIYFTTHFYNEFNPKLDEKMEDLDGQLDKNKDTIFNALSNNEHHGYFLFSIFDDFNGSIEELLDSNRISKYISTREFSILQEFINDYIDLKGCFNWITEKDFIKYKKIINVKLSESKFTKSSNSSETFYDAIFSEDNKKTVTYYTAKFKLFDENALVYKYKLSGNKAKDISNLLYKLYNDIKRWKKIRGIEKITFDNALISCGRLYLDDSITFNSHMNQNISIHGVF